MEQLLAGIDCQFNLSDDIFVWGAEGTSDHDKNLMSILSRLDSRGATLNAKKYIMQVTELEFFGMKFSSNGNKH